MRVCLLTDEVIEEFNPSVHLKNYDCEVLDFGSLPVPQLYGAMSVPKYHFENGPPDPYAQIDRTQEIQAGETTYCRSGY